MKLNMKEWTKSCLDNYAEKIGADFFTPDAGSAAEVAKRAVLEKK